MICVLRVSGTGLDETTILTSSNLQPYRIEKESLHFDVTTADNLSFTETLEAIQSFIAQHEKMLMSLSTSSKVSSLEPITPA